MQSTPLCLAASSRVTEVEPLAIASLSDRFDRKDLWHVVHLREAVAVACITSCCFPEFSRLLTESLCDAFVDIGASSAEPLSTFVADASEQSLVDGT